MAKDGLPPISALDKPEKLQDLLKQDRVDDCLPCKVVGGGAFLGLGVYTFWTGHKQLELQKAQILASKSMFGLRSRRIGINALSLALGMLGFWRFAK